MNQLTLPGVPSAMGALPMTQPGYAQGMGSFGEPVAPAPAASVPTIPSAATNFSGMGQAVGGAINAAGGIDAVAPQQFSWGGMAKNTLFNKEGGLNLGGMGDLATGLGALGSVWAAMQANKVAGKTLDFQEKAYNTNLTNQIGSFNMALEDRINSRMSQNNGTKAEAQTYINKHKLEA